MKIYRAKVKIGASVVDVKVEAQNPIDARKILEAQYGKGSIFSPPMEMR